MSTEMGGSAVLIPHLSEIDDEVVDEVITAGMPAAAAAPLFSHANDIGYVDSGAMIAMIRALLPPSVPHLDTSGTERLPVADMEVAGCGLWDSASVHEYAVVLLENSMCEVIEAITTRELMRDVAATELARTPASNAGQDYLMSEGTDGQAEGCQQTLAAAAFRTTLSPAASPPPSDGSVSAINYRLLEICFGILANLCSFDDLALHIAQHHADLLQLLLGTAIHQLNSAACLVELCRLGSAGLSAAHAHPSWFHLLSSKDTLARLLWIATSTLDEPLLLRSLDLFTCLLHRHPATMLQPLLEVGVLGLACDVLHETAITCVRRKKHRVAEHNSDDPNSSPVHGSWSASDDDEDDGDTHWRQYRRDGPSCTPGKTPGGGRYTPYTTRGWQERGDPSASVSEASDEDEAERPRGYPISGAVADATLRLLEEVVNLPQGKAAVEGTKPAGFACTLDVTCLGPRVSGESQPLLPLAQRPPGPASCHAGQEADAKLDVLSLLLLLFLHGNSAIKSGVLLVLVDVGDQAASRVVASHHCRHFTTHLLEVCGDAKNAMEESAAWFMLACVLQQQSAAHLQQQQGGAMDASGTAVGPVACNGPPVVAVVAPVSGGATWPVLLLRLSDIPFPDDCAPYVSTCVEAGLRLLSEECTLGNNSDTAIDSHSTKTVTAAAQKALHKLRRRFQRRSGAAL